MYMCKDKFEHAYMYGWGRPASLHLWYQGQFPDLYYIVRYLIYVNYAYWVFINIDKKILSISKFCHAYI